MIPISIKKALDEVKTMRMCRFTSKLIQEKEYYKIEAEISSSKVNFRTKTKKYKVRFFIPHDFPLRKVI